jgi:signal transduction histidine kinase
VADGIEDPVALAVATAGRLAERTAGFEAEVRGGALRRAALEAFLRDAGEAAGAILTSLRLAGDLVAGFKQVAVDQTSEIRREVDVRAYLRDVAASLAGELRNTRHRLETDAEPGLRLVTMPGVLAQVATILVTNSVLHAYGADHPGGCMRLQAAAHPRDRARGGIRLTFTDDGCGIPPEVLPRIFDAFLTTRRVAGHSGLGLHIAHNLVTARLGGTITAESGPGPGSRFVLDLPHLAAEPTAAEPDLASRRPGAGETEHRIERSVRSP